MDKKKKGSQEAVKAYANEESKKRDPLGSWTGCPAEKNEKPVQDADDL